MSRKERFPSKRQRTRHAAPPPLVRSAAAAKAPTQYGPPFVVLEDPAAKTFVYQAGTWIPHDMTIAACRATCQVKLLPQKVNGMSRYEVRRPIN